MITPNDGQRPSKFLLDQLATGELDGAEADAVKATLDDGSRAHLDALEAARGVVAPFDTAALRARAASLDASVDAAVSTHAPQPANNTRAWRVWAPLIALAAVFAVAVLPGLLPADPDGAVEFRSGDTLAAFQLHGEVLEPYAGSPVGDGDVLGFKVSATRHRSVVVLSVDGRGQVSVFWPESGSAAEPISGDGLVELEGTVVLDGAPGPEVFVAVFDADVPEARSEVERAFQSGGHQGLVEWAQLTEGFDAVKVQRR